MRHGPIGECRFGVAVDDLYVQAQLRLDAIEQFEDRLISSDLLLVKVLLERRADSRGEVGLIEDGYGRNFEEGQPPALLHIKHDHAYVRTHRSRDFGGDRLGCLTWD